MLFMDEFIIAGNLKKNCKCFAFYAIYKLIILVLINGF